MAEGAGFSTKTIQDSNYQGIAANGSWVQLKLNGKPVGLVTNVSYEESFGLQAIQVLNKLNAISYDPANYTCTISIGTFVPNKAKFPSGASTPDGGEIHGGDILGIDVEQVWETGLAPEWGSMELYDTRSKKTLALFEAVILDKSSVNIQKGQQVAMNLNFYAVKRKNI